MIKRRVKSPNKFGSTVRPHSSQDTSRQRFQQPAYAIDRSSPNNSVLLEKKNEHGQKEFLLAPIERNTNLIHVHGSDTVDKMNLPLFEDSADNINAKKNLYAWSDQVERS